MGGGDGRGERSGTCVISLCTCVKFSKTKKIFKKCCDSAVRETETCWENETSMAHHSRTDGVSVSTALGKTN